MMSLCLQNSMSKSNEEVTATVCNLTQHRRLLGQYACPTKTHDRFVQTLILAF